MTSAPPAAFFVTRTSALMAPCTNRRLTVPSLAKAAAPTVGVNRQPRPAYSFLQNSAAASGMAAVAYCTKWRYSADTLASAGRGRRVASGLPRLLRLTFTVLVLASRNASTCRPALPNVRLRYLSGSVSGTARFCSAHPSADIALRRKSATASGLPGAK